MPAETNSGRPLVRRGFSSVCTGVNRATDQELLRRFQAGSQDAYQSLVRRWTPRLDSLAWRWLGNVEEARDVRQTAFLRLWSSPRTCGEGRFGTWIHRVVLNLCRDRLRSRRTRREVGPAEPAAPDSAASDVVARSEVQARVARAVAALPDAERDVVVLRQYADLPFSRVAEVLDIPVTTAKSRMWRALERLRGLLEECAP